jgi:hypothetical protein
MTYDDRDLPGPEDGVGQGPARRGDPDMVTFGGGVLVGAVVLALVWAFVALLGPGDGGGGGGGGGGSGSESANLGTLTVPGGDLRRDAERRCGEAVAALSRPLEAAAPAMDQWSVHIGAMNKLVVGAISLAQANAFWNRTRVGARRNITAFREALRDLRSHGVDCPAPDVLPAGASSSLQACSRRVQADLRTLRAARTAVDTWARHVRDMERLRTGKLSPAAATRMWLMMWQQGQDQLDAYRAAVQAARKAGAC